MEVVVLNPPRQSPRSTVTTIVLLIYHNKIRPSVGVKVCDRTAEGSRREVKYSVRGKQCARGARFVQENDCDVEADAQELLPAWLATRVQMPSTYRGNRSPCDRTDSGRDRAKRYRELESADALTENGVVPNVTVGTGWGSTVCGLGTMLGKTVKLRVICCAAL